MNPHSIAFWALVAISAALYVWHYASELHRARQARQQAAWDAHCGPVTGPPTYDTLRAEYAADGRGLPDATRVDWAAFEADLRDGGVA